MQVETYEIQETANEEIENKAEIEKLCSELGLEGQKKIMGEDDGLRCPYRKMTAEEQSVYSILLSNQQSVQKFDEIIPLRVLQIAAHAKNIFKELTVWSSKNAVIPDPILVGVGENRELYLLARWGDVLLPLQELAVKAAEIFKQKLMAKYQQNISEINSKFEALKKCEPKDLLGAKEEYQHWCHITA